MSSIRKVGGFGEAGQVVIEIVHETCRQSVYNIWSALIDQTPVCSGKAAASWFASANRPVTTDRLPDVPYDGHCVRVYDDPRLEFSTPEALLGKYNRNYSKWYISNPVDYIDDLNDGFSTKAPAGFVDVAVKIGLASRVK